MSHVTLVDSSTSTVSIDCYLWDFGDGAKDNENTNPLHTYKDTGDYLVVLTTTNSQGCASVSQNVVRIKDVYSMYIPTGVTLNSDGLNDELKIVARGVKRIHTVYTTAGAKRCLKPLNWVVHSKVLITKARN